MNLYVYDLRAKGIHPTYQRVKILECLRLCSGRDFLSTEKARLWETANGQPKNYHPSVEQVYCVLSKHITTLSKTTVYKTLKLFEEKGIISAVMIDQHGALRFEHQTHAHAHLFCNCCGELYDWPAPESMLQQVEECQQADQALQSWQLVFKGQCSGCLT